MKCCVLILTLVVGSWALLPPHSSYDEKEDDSNIESIFADDNAQEYEPSTTPSPMLPQKCGIRIENWQWRSAGMTTANFAEFPWTVAVFESLWNGTEKYICVGSLIHPRLVLSVAHYFNEKRNWRIRAGDWALDSTAEVWKHQMKDVDRAVIHPNFNKSNLKFDIALLILSTAITPMPAGAKNIGFACLPAANAVTLPGAQCIATGWGRKDFNDPKTANILKMMGVPAVSPEVCQERLRTRIGQSFKMHSTYLCAGGVRGQDACLQDGGGPLVCPYTTADKQYYQAGIVSWGHGCGIEGVPGVYTNVAELRQWIDDTVISLGFTTNYYNP